MSYSMPGGMGDAIWISTPGAYQGKWNFLGYYHYSLMDELATAPVAATDLTSETYGDEGGKTFGTKTGQDQSLDCEIVSRWPSAVTGAPFDFTIFAPMQLVRAR